MSHLLSAGLPRWLIFCQFLFAIVTTLAVHWQRPKIYLGLKQEGCGSRNFVLGHCQLEYRGQHLGFEFKQRLLPVLFLNFNKICICKHCHNPKSSLAITGWKSKVKNTGMFINIFFQLLSFIVATSPLHKPHIVTTANQDSCCEDVTSFISRTVKMTHLLPVSVCYCHKKKRWDLSVYW